MSTIIVPCPACQGEGRDIRYGVTYEPGCGHPHMGEVDRGMCDACKGRGEIEEETAVRTLADLEEQDFEEGIIGDPAEGYCPCGLEHSKCKAYSGDCLYGAEP